jgi:hypothetical protein
MDQVQKNPLKTVEAFLIRRVIFLPEHIKAHKRVQQKQYEKNIFGCLDDQM